MDSFCKKVEIIWNGHTSFVDIVEGIYETLTELQCIVDKVNLQSLNNKIWLDDTTYIFIPMMIYADSLSLNHPKHFIFYQIEQHNSSWMTDKYLSLVEKADQLWNFHDKYENISDFFRKHPNSYYVPFAYHPYLEQGNVKEKIVKDIDILFLGSINHRRMSIINSLKDKGLKVFYGAGYTRDEHISLINRSKIYLNIHYYGEDSAMESARISLAICQSAFVISEPSIIESENKLFNKFLLISSNTEDLINKCYEYVHNDDLRINFTSDVLQSYRANFPLKSYIEPCSENFHVYQKERILYLTAKFGNEIPKGIAKPLNTDIFKYICYTDDKEAKLNNNLTMLECEYCRFNEDEKKEISDVIYDKGMTRPNVLKARFVKTQFYKLQKVREFNPTVVIWVDGNIQIIKNDFHSVIKTTINNAVICTYPHNFLNNYIKDLDFTLENKSTGIVKRYGDEPIEQQKEFYIQEGYTIEKTMKKEYLCTGIYGLYLNEKSINMLNLWWQDILKWSIHDQVSLFYILFKHNIDNSYIRTGTILGSDYHWYWHHK
jgi:hypothetical protein